MTTSRPRSAARRATGAARRIALLAGAVVAAACNGAITDITATGGAPGIGVGIGDGSSSVEHPSALVGRWSHVTYYRDAAGALHASETRWEFFPAGSVTRTVITTNITFGLQDVEVREGAWTAAAGEIVVAFAPPSSGTVRLQWRLDRSTQPPGLWLNETRFTRVA